VALLATFLKKGGGGIEIFSIKQINNNDFWASLIDVSWAKMTQFELKFKVLAASGEKGRRTHKMPRI
jgi:hypothetical protein